MGAGLAEGPALVEDPAWLAGAALEQAVEPLEPVAVDDRKCKVDLLVLFEAVWRWDGGLGGEWAVIGDLRSIARLRVFWKGSWVNWRSFLR